VTVILLVVLPLVVLLFALIHHMNHGAHDTPQAYYRRQTTGAPVALGVEALGPRRRKHHGDDGASAGASSQPASQSRPEPVDALSRL
jgi:hypothetical protein